MDEYDLITKSGLRLKGEKKKKKKKKKHSHTAHDASAVGQDERAEDADDHGGWWKTTDPDQVRGYVALEFLPGCYAKSLSNGRVVLGKPHTPGESPEEEEIFMALSAGPNLIAFKSGFDRYLSIDSRKRLVGISEAIGEAETFLPVFEDGRSAVSNKLNDCFLSVDEDSSMYQIVAKSTQAGPNEMINIRVEINPTLAAKKSWKELL